MTDTTLRVIALYFAWTALTAGVCLAAVAPCYQDLTARLVIYAGTCWLFAPLFAWAGIAPPPDIEEGNTP